MATILSLDDQSAESDDPIRNLGKDQYTTDLMYRFPRGWVMDAGGRRNV